MLPSAKVSFLVSITNKTFRFAVVDDQITMVEGAFMVFNSSFPGSNFFIGAYNVREECRQGSKACMDIIFYIHQCLVVHCSGVLSTHSTAAVLSYGMRGHLDHVLQSSPLLGISLCCSTGFCPMLLFKFLFRFLHRTPTGSFLRHILCVVV